MLVSLTVGKVDAGVAVLLTEDKRLIEFPSILLPASITSGSIVDITVSQNHQAEQKSQAAFNSLQSQILNTYGLESPTAPVLRLRNATQTSIVLEWDPIELATSTLRSLALYRNGSKAGNIPRPMDMLSTKISGLAVDTEYSFYLVLRTTAGTYPSNILTVKTHNMNNLTGITVTPGVLPPQLRESLETAVKRIGAKLAENVRIDTTHFVCTEGRGKDWERANEMNIPVVRPEWIEGCEREGKLIGVRGYYLDANPKHRQIGSNPVIVGNQSAPGSQTTIAPGANALPIRSGPTSPNEESPVSGEPGPEVPPTPPPKNGSQPTSKEEEESEEESELSPEPEKSRVQAEAPSSPGESENEEHSENPGNGKIADVKEQGGEMEEVAL